MKMEVEILKFVFAVSEILKRRYFKHNLAMNKTPNFGFNGG